MKIFDIAANLSDARYIGKYNRKQQHAPDFDKVIERANLFGVKKFLFASTNIADAKISYKLSLKSKDFYSTIGIHPCRAIEPYKSAHLKYDTLNMTQKNDALKKYIDEIDKMLTQGKDKDIRAFKFIQKLNYR